MYKLLKAPRFSHLLIGAQSLSLLFSAYKISVLLPLQNAISGNNSARGQVYGWEKGQK